MSFLKPLMVMHQKSLSVLIFIPDQIDFIRRTKTDGASILQKLLKNGIPSNLLLNLQLINWERLLVLK